MLRKGLPSKSLSIHIHGIFPPAVDGYPFRRTFVSTRRWLTTGNHTSNNCMHLAWEIIKRGWQIEDPSPWKFWLMEELSNWDFGCERMGVITQHIYAWFANEIGTFQICECSLGHPPPTAPESLPFLGCGGQCYFFQDVCRCWSQTIRPTTV